MKKVDISMEAYSYELPPSRIATYPVEDRDSSKLLVFKDKQLTSDCFNNIPDYFNNEDVLIRNTTRVVQARLYFHKTTGARIEVFLIEPVEPKDYQLNFASAGLVEWRCIVRNLKKWNEKVLFQPYQDESVTFTLSAELMSNEDNNIHVRFRWTPEDLSFAKVIELLGNTPIPPYLNRAAEAIDKPRYQTIYAEFDGSVAAPTAGLHFTKKIIDQIEHNQTVMKSLTLHVGAGTFIPVKSNTIEDHEMHQEEVIIDRSLIEFILDHPYHKITSIGTTSLRSLESLYWLGHKMISAPKKSHELLIVDQWAPYQSNTDLAFEECLQSVLNHLDNTSSKLIKFKTGLIIVPGYQFRFVDKLLTNFHQPRSTLLLLVAAFSGNRWKEIYQFALDNDFRFLSYGDSSLLERT